MKVPVSSPYFPFEKIRAGQSQFMGDVSESVRSNIPLIAHAPTGIGKTAAVLSATLPFDKTILYLVPKQSQHQIVIETLQAISKHTGKSINTVDIISKQAMCPQESMRSLYFADFLRQCFNLRKGKACEFWDNQKHLVDSYGIVGVEDLMKHGQENSMCPYYLGFERLQTAEVVVADYNLVFSDMSGHVMEELGKSPGDVIIIVDEAHNLPSRVINHLSGSLTANKLDSAAAEIRKENYVCYQLLKSLQTTLKSYLKKESKGMKPNSKRQVDKTVFEGLVEDVLSERFETTPYQTFVSELKDHLYNNYSCEVAKFLQGWANMEECIHMVVTKEKGAYLTYKCLDPSIMTRPIVDAHTVIAMSGTLYPMEMYRDVLGFPKNTNLREYVSPYPKTNKLSVITTELTSEYTQRTDLMFMKLGKAISDMATGNTLVFFPSYSLLNTIKERMSSTTTSRIIVEKQSMTKEEKQEMYRFVVDYGAILFGVQGGSFSEGFDYKNNVIETVIVVGLPLAPPDIDVKAQIDYYTGKFGKQLGKKYAYVYPSLRKAIQAAGRGIRSETDRCAVVYMDYRYGYSTYKECFEDEVGVYDVGTVCGMLEDFKKGDKAKPYMG